MSFNHTASHTKTQSKSSLSTSNTPRYRPSSRPFKRIPPQSKLERKFEQSLIEAGLTGYVREFEFRIQNPLARRTYPSWRVDFMFDEYKLACELEGGREYVTRRAGKLFMDGIHQTSDGRRKSYCKSAELQLAGYTVLHFTESQIDSGQHLSFIKRAIKRAVAVKECACA